MKQVGHNEAKEVGAPRNQSTRGEVRAVVQFPDTLQDARLGFLADVGMIAEGFGDGDNGDAEVSRNVLQGDSHI